MRLAQLLWPLAVCLVLDPQCAHSQVKTAYFGNQGRLDGLKLTGQGSKASPRSRIRGHSGTQANLLPHVTVPAIGAHGRARLSADKVESMARKSIFSGQPAVVLSGHEPATQIYTDPRGKISILPGLPGALIAVVEGASPEMIAASNPGKTDPVPLAAVSAEAVRIAPTGPVSLTATTVDDADPAKRGLFLPFELDVGAAAFSRGGDLLVVFDAARPFDLSAIQGEPMAARASIQLLPEATILRLPGRQASELNLSRVANGWLVQLTGSRNADKIINPVVDGGVIRIPVEYPGRTVVVPDPQTGGNLLIGTIRRGGDRVAVQLRASTEIVEQTIQGIVIDPLSDRVELHPTKKAFLLSGVGVDVLRNGGVTPDSLAADGAAGPRIMSLAAGPSDVLRRRFQEAAALAAEAPVEGRFAPRLKAAQDALAVGDAAQADAIARVALADDPREVDALLPQLVIAAAALVSHHPDRIDLLDRPRTPANGELELWHAVKLAEQDPASIEAARMFAGNLRLLRSYPAPLQAVLLPIAAESLARAGTDAQAAMIDHLPPDNPLAFARAILAKRRGQVPAALAILDHLSADRDIRVADKATEEGVAIRWGLPSADYKTLLKTLDAHLLDARISGNEVSSRFNLARLLGVNGQFRDSLRVLRETATLYPGQQVEVRRQVGEVLKHIAAARLPPDDDGALDQAAMIEGNTDMLPEGADGSRISLFLAKRLGALDLPERAIPIVKNMMRVADPGLDKAELGLELASLNFQTNDLQSAETALRESDPGNLPPDRTSPRLILMARILAAGGKLEQALATIAPLETDLALDLRASLLARRGDWEGATDTLVKLVAASHSLTGKLDGAGQDMLLRLASAASRTKSKLQTDRVRKIGNGRFSDPGKEALFRLLASDPGTDGITTTESPSDVAGLVHTRDILNSITK